MYDSENNKSFARNSNAKYSVDFSMSIWLMTAFICTIFIIAGRDYIKLWIIPLIILLPAAVFYMLRKTMFGKVRLNDEGVAFTYKKQVLKEIKWEEIKKIEVYLTVVVFAKIEKAAKGIHHFNLSKNYMSVDLEHSVLKEFCEELKKHLPKLSFDIDSKTMEKIESCSNWSISRRRRSESV